MNKMRVSNLRSRGVLIAVIAVCFTLAGLAVYVFWHGPNPPDPDSPVYEQYVEAFQLGVAALDSDLPQIAEQNLQRAINLVPREPAGWANCGLLYLRTGRLPEAESQLEQAQLLAPDDPDVQKLLGLLKQRRGLFGEAAAHLRRALERDRDDIKARYLLAQIIDQERQEGSDEEYQRLMEHILATRPGNLLVLLSRLTVAVRRSDAKAVRNTLERFDQLSLRWQERTRLALEELKKTLNGSLGPEAVPRLLKFSNVLRAEPAFPRSAAEVSPQDTFAGDSLQSFRWLVPVRHAPAPPDMQLTFALESAATFPDGDCDAVLPVWLAADGPLAVFVASAQEVRRGGDPMTLPSLPTSPDGFVAFDWNNDLRTDLLLAGAQGLKFKEQQADGTFQDVTAKLGLAEEVLSGAYHSVLPADVDLDGDLDVLVSRRSGSPLWLRNSLDGTFSSQPIFANLDGPQTFTWADFDTDGAPDAALLDAAGKLQVFSNERSGSFRAWSAAPPGDRMLALTSADANDDNALDILVIREDGSLLALSDRDKQSRWDIAELAQWEQVASEKAAVVSLLLAADFDNNGALDLLASGSESSGLWLGAGGGKFAALAASLPPRILASADLRDTGRLDLLGVDKGGRPFQLRNTGHQDYHWQTIRPQAAREKVEGDNRINSFGFGGEIEIRSGTHVVKQPIRSPLVHFGLGRRTQADVVRIVWPNGAAQYEFGHAVDKSTVAVQRLKGSCPFLFAWNGERFEFVTDFMWSTPLGMYINAADKGGFLQTTDWVKIAGDQLVVREGSYELRVNANLWETHYFDHLALMVVDHPADTEMFVDERFCLEPSEPTLHLTSASQSVARAWDHQGRDATKELLAVDGMYLDRCGRGLYQGITSDHWVEFDRGDDVPGEGPLWLVARGWIHPTDSSINYALEQGKNDKPRSLVLEVPDGQGGWKVGRDRLGFPAGKNKTILVQLDGLGDAAEIPRRFRLRTNMEIYWDSLQIARGANDTLARRQVLLADRAELRFRGVVAMSQASPSSPELPHYDEIVSRGQLWRDLIGYHTRFGEIGELLQQVDDRYAILTAGDDVALRFEAPADPPPGWTRDFVWVADGWVKDGDLNTRFGKTVLPLPAHDMQSYDTPPGALEDDPVYRRHPQDWEKFHTRHVIPHMYEQGLRSFRIPQGRNDLNKP